MMREREDLSDLKKTICKRVDIIDRSVYSYGITDFRNLFLRCDRKQKRFILAQ